MEEKDALRIRKINIKDIRYGKKTEIRNHVLYLNNDQLTKIVFEDELIKSAKIEIARPGESVRIIPVKDVLQPRVKVKVIGTIFPGVIGNKVAQVGFGRTHVL